MSGYLITLEGTDLSGKTSTLMRLDPWLREQGIPLITSREPGGTRVGDDIRQVVHNVEHAGVITYDTEALLYQASRAQLIEELVQPSLDAGKVVVLDRYRDSSLVYQGVGRGLGVGYIGALNEASTKGLQPDLTLFFDINPDAARKRSQRLHLNRMDTQPPEYYHNVYQAYHAMIWLDELEAIEEGRLPRWVRIDATKTLDEVVLSARGVIEERLIMKGILEGNLRIRERR